MLGDKPGRQVKVISHNLLKHYAHDINFIQNTILQNFTQIIFLFFSHEKI